MSDEPLIILHSWSFNNYQCRIVEDAPGIVHFEQGYRDPNGPAIMPFPWERTNSPMGTANEIINLSLLVAQLSRGNESLPEAVERAESAERRASLAESDAKQMKECWDAACNELAEAEARVEKLKSSLGRARGDINWMLNMEKFLTPGCFDYIDAALADFEEG